MGIASSVKSDIASQKDPQRINVLFVCGEWNSSKGGLATFNRQSAINLAKVASDKIKVFCYVSQSNAGERKDAKQHGVHMITGRRIPGTSDPLEWLRVPPQQLLHPDVVVGHGLKFGTPACCIARATSCKWVHFAHVLYEDLGKYKQTGEKAASSPDTIEENEKKHKEEIELCKEANAVIAVGSRLQQKYRKCLPGIEVDVITPGILEKFCHLSDQKEIHSSDEFSIFVFGRASFEDLALKGNDIIADAVGSLGEKFSITFVGAPEGQHRNMEERFLQKTRITRRQLTLRSYCNQQELKTMFFAADMVAMPSRTEGFGLVALEAMSAGIPILVTRESGIANALERVEGGKSVIVESEKAEENQNAIRGETRRKTQECHFSQRELQQQTPLELTVSEI